MCREMTAKSFHGECGWNPQQLTLLYAVTNSNSHSVNGEGGARPANQELNLILFNSWLATLQARISV